MRHRNELFNLKGTTPIANIWRAVKDSITKAPPAYDMNGLVSENRWTWIKKNIGSIWRSRYTPYPYYAQPEVNNGIFKISKNASEPVVIALLADWASDTAESRLIASQAGVQDYSIHLGDTYYVGNSQEIAENFDTDQSGTWPYGNLGSFAIPGNHEMYSGGKAYFTELLPYMGLYKGNAQMPTQVQQASYFCLENDYWRIVALDTGYDSLTGFLGLTPNGQLQLLPEQQNWLTNTLKLNDDKRGLIFLSHHQAFSGFEDEFAGPAKFISGLLTQPRDIIWLWGHEHWFSVYAPNKLAGGPNIFGRCIGNSGMPVELDNDDGGIHKPKNNDPTSWENRNLVLFDQRQRKIVGNNIRLGHNGYVQLTLNGNNARIAYFDDNDGNAAGRLILDENWTVDMVSGVLTGLSITDYTVTAASLMQQLSLFGNDLRDAIDATKSQTIDL